MATDILLADISPALPGPELPPSNASPVAHLNWCMRFGAYCERQARVAREFDLPTWKWLRAAELVAFSAAIWRERTRRGAA